MTTYYGVWSDWSGRDGKEWWRNSSGELFRTTLFRVALAQAMVTNAIWKRGPAYGTRKDERWQARVIGEDGLPVTELGLLPPTSEPPRAAAEFVLTEEQKQIRLEAASHICTICSDMATNWVAMRDREWYFCERHEAWGQYVLSDHLRRRPVYYEEAEP